MKKTRVINLKQKKKEDAMFNFNTLKTLQLLKSKVK